MHTALSSFGGNMLESSLPNTFPHSVFQGPVIKAEVGDTVLVTFANKARRSYSIMAHGVSFSKLSEGAPYLDGKFWLHCCIVISTILESKNVLLSSAGLPFWAC